MNNSSQENPFVLADEWREEKMRREVPGTVPEDLYWVVDELLEQEHEPQLFAKGSEHLVFRFKEKGVVAKVNYQESWWAYQALLNHDKAGLDEALRQMEMRRVEHQKKLKDLEWFFGRSAVPRQRVFIAEVPVSAKVANELGAELVEGDGPEKVPAWISIQRAVDLESGEAVTLGGYYLEKAVMASDEPQDLMNYKLVHDLLVDTDKTADDSTVYRLVRLMEGLDGVERRLSRDPTFRPALQDAVRRMIDYSTATSEVLDLAGLDNVVLVREGSGWKLKLIDPLAASDCNYRSLRTASLKLAAGEELDGEEVMEACYAMNTLRVINALAILSGIPERLDIPEVRRVSAKGWFDALAEAEF
jgi:hypothetical protein